MREYLEAMERDELRAEYLELAYEQKEEAPAENVEMMSEADMLRYEYLGLIDSSENVTFTISNVA